MVEASVGGAHQLGQQGHCREDVASLEETDEEPGEEVDIEVWSETDQVEGKPVAKSATPYMRKRQLHPWSSTVEQHIAGDV